MDKIASFICFPPCCKPQNNDNDTEIKISVKSNCCKKKRYQIIIKDKNDIDRVIDLISELHRKDSV